MNSTTKQTLHKARQVFEIIVDHRSEGIGQTDIKRIMEKRGWISQTKYPDYLSLLEHAGYLVWTENGKVYPFRNCHTGQEYF